MPKEYRHTTMMFQARNLEDALLPLSTLHPESPLFKGILALENAIMHTGRGAMDSHLVDPSQQIKDKEWLTKDSERSRIALEQIRELIESPLNKQGDFYKFWFDIHGKNYFPGNNVLLTAISRACHSVSQWHSEYVAEMVLMILHDARVKLSPLCFKHYLSFRFIPSTLEGENSDYYFDNTPLSLAIVTGLRRVVDVILELGILTKEDINIRTGSGYVIKDALNRIIRENPMLLSAAHLAALRLSVTQLEVDLQLLMKLHECGADFTLQDEYGKTVPDLAKIEIPQFIPNSILRRNEQLSSYAHRLEYDACFTDNYRMPDPYDPCSTPLVKYPDIFPLPPGCLSNCSKKEIHEALSSIPKTIIPDEVAGAHQDHGKLLST